MHRRIGSREFSLHLSGTGPTCRHLSSGRRSAEAYEADGPMHLDPASATRRAAARASDIRAMKRGRALIQRAMISRGAHRV